MKKVDRASSDINAGLVVLAGGPHTWVLSEPGKKGLRTVYFDDKDEGQGVLLGSVIPMGLGYMTQSPDVEIGRYMGIKFRESAEQVLISTEVTAIIVMAKQEIAVVSS